MTPASHSLSTQGRIAVVITLCALTAATLPGCSNKEPPTPTAPSAASAPAAASSAPRAAAAHPLAGHWQVEGSTAVFDIRTDQGAVQLTGKDANDGESFVITNTQWNGTTLTADFLMPSTKWRTRSKLALTGPDTLSGKYKDGSVELWTRGK
jgi:hypothetical protein